ncbi:MAG: arsenate reductase ArsC, partial [Bacteroidota bacterium]
MKTVLVLCTGNSCRSQIAEGYLSFYANGRARIYSAGLEKHGLNPFAVEVMGEDSIDISDATSNTVEEIEHSHFDFVLTVCDHAVKNVPVDLSYEHTMHFSIDDPATAEGSKEEKMAVFRKVREEIKISMLKFIGRELIS